MTIDPTQLKVGSYIRYDMSRFGIVSDPAIKIQVLDENDRAYYVDGVRAQLWWTSGSGTPHMLREDDVPVNKIQEIVGERELPKPIQEERTVRLAPKRTEGYKDCERAKCIKTVYGVISTQVLRNPIGGFKFGNIEPGAGALLIGLCAEHYKERNQYGIVGQTWTAYPKPEPSTLPVERVSEPAKGQSAVDTTVMRPRGKSKATTKQPKPKVAKVPTIKAETGKDGRSSRWAKMTPEQRDEQVRKMKAGRKGIS